MLNLENNWYLDGENLYNWFNSIKEYMFNNRKVDGPFSATLWESRWKELSQASWNSSFWRGLSGCSFNARCALVLKARYTSNRLSMLDAHSALAVSLPTSLATSELCSCIEPPFVRSHIQQYVKVLLWTKIYPQLVAEKQRLDFLHYSLCKFLCFFWLVSGVSRQTTMLFRQR